MQHSLAFATSMGMKFSLCSLLSSLFPLTINLSFLETLYSLFIIFKNNPLFQKHIWSTTNFSLIAIYIILHRLYDINFHRYLSLWYWYHFCLYTTYYHHLCELYMYFQCTLKAFFFKRHGSIISKLSKPCVFSFHLWNILYVK